MASEQAPNRGSKFGVIDLVVVLVCLLAGGLAVVSRSENDGADLNGERQLDTPDSASLYVCPDDGATLSVTPAVFDRMLACGRAGPPEGSPPHTRGLYVRCPECGKRVMVQGARCPEHGTAYVLADAHGNPCVCPRCLAETFARGEDPQHTTDEAG
jgi:predicted RNA-binding Zn-ribbon protein involved in translation (DUF1610 family)